MTDKEIIKALECCANIDAGCEGCPLYDYDCEQTTLAGLALDLINRYEAEIERLGSDLKVAKRLLEDREKMPLPYDEDEFLRKAVLQVIGWIEEMPNYRMFGTVVLTKTRLDEMKANIVKEMTEVT